MYTIVNGTHRRTSSPIKDTNFTKKRNAFRVMDATHRFARNHSSLILICTIHHVARISIQSTIDKRREFVKANGEDAIHKKHIHEGQ